MAEAAHLAAVTPRGRIDSPSPVQIADNAIRRRAVEAAIWGMPMVAVDAMRQAFFRAGAGYHDIVYFSRPADSRFQIPTPTASALYVYFNFTVKDGPVVLEFPPSVGATLTGSLLDAWQAPLADVGADGEDRGNGAKYLLLPPGFRGDVAGGHVPVHSSTYNGYAMFRLTPASRAPEDTARALDLVKQLRVYPRSEAANRPPSRHIDIAGASFDGIARMDETFFDALAKMVNEEPVQAQDLVAMGQLRSIGMEKGKAFRPDPATRVVLRRAAREAHDTFMSAINTGATPYWSDAKWGIPPCIVSGSRTGFTFQNGHALNVDDRAAMFFFACGEPKHAGGPPLALIGSRDRTNTVLDGGRSYRLQVPANVPATRGWAITAYDVETSAFIAGAPTVEIASEDELHVNRDGSVDLFFGPKAPARKPSNWISTATGRRWMAVFRIYGPERAIRERTWTMNDIEAVK